MRFSSIRLRHFGVATGQNRESLATGDSEKGFFRGLAFGLP